MKMKPVSENIISLHFTLSGGYETPKMKLMKSFYENMRKEYKDTMERVYILNSNIITRLIMKMVEPFLKSENRGKIKTISSRVELLQEGIPMSVITKVWKNV
jgi:hypothetical protein